MLLIPLYRFKSPSSIIFLCPKFFFIISSSADILVKNFCSIIFVSGIFIQGFYAVAPGFYSAESEVPLHSLRWG